MRDRESLLSAARESSAEVVVLGPGQRTVTSWSKLTAGAEQSAERLDELGLCQGMLVGLAGRTSLGLLELIQAVWMVGACPAVLPMTITRGEPAAVLDSSLRLIEDLGPELILVDQPLLDRVHGRSETPIGSMQDAKNGSLRQSIERRASGEILQSAALLQLTSGTTASPRAVSMPDSAFTACLHDMALGMDLNFEEDRIFSWLPLYHDMGFIGMFALAMHTGTSLVLSDPSDFVGQPSSWHSHVAQTRASIICAPNFAYELAARILAAKAEHPDLSHVRIALNGAEPVRASTVVAYQQAGSRFGLRDDVVMPVYGLAEATLGVTFSRPGSPVRVAQPPFVPPDATPRGILPQDRCVSVGHPLAGLELRIVSEDVGGVGEIQVRGASAETFYVAPGRASLISTKNEEGWLPTGDEGFERDGDLFVCGRRKDVMVVGGRNIYPDPIEALVAEMPGVRKGRVAAFGVSGNGTEQVIVVAEASETAPDPTAIAQKVLATFAVRPQVCIWPGGTIIKTTSGKVSRSACRAEYRQRQMDATDLTSRP